MAHDWQTNGPWDNNTLSLRDKRAGQSGRLTGYGRTQWQQVQRHPIHGWDPPADSTPYFYTYQAERLTALFPAILTSHRVLIIGSGIGYFVEAMKDLGYASTYGIEPHAPLQARVDAEGRGDVITVKKTFGANTIPNIQAEMVALTGASTFRWIVTDMIMPRYSDANLSFLANDGPTFLEGGAPESNIINLVVPIHMGPDPADPDPENPTLPFVQIGQDTDYFFRTLAEYQALVPNQTIVNMEGAWEIYTGP